MLHSRLGMQKFLTPAGPSESKRRHRTEPKHEPKRDSGVWKYMTVLREHATSPEVLCIFCDTKFCGGATHPRAPHGPCARQQAEARVLP